MDQEVKTKWCKALRSNDYEQGTDALRSYENKFCCLGVLWDIDGGEWKQHEDFENSYIIDIGFDGVLPIDYRKEIGLDVFDMQLLIKMNDAGKTFEEIADWIEEKL